jgi:CYTH domain-containing protein
MARPILCAVVGIRQQRSAAKNQLLAHANILVVGREIERKFLVTSDAWRAHTSERHRLTQGYLLAERHRSVRVRIDGTRAFLTIKGAISAVERREFEYEIPVGDAVELLAMCEEPLIEKTRHLVGRFEIDEFHGGNSGLVVAEIELEAPDEPFSRPAWLGAEVTDDPRYLNANLFRHPFVQWR